MLSSTLNSLNLKKKKKKTAPRWWTFLYSSNSPQGSPRVLWDAGDNYCGNSVSTIWNTSNTTAVMVSGVPVLPHGQQWAGNISALGLPESLCNNLLGVEGVTEQELIGLNKGQSGCALTVTEVMYKLLLLGSDTVLLRNWDEIVWSHLLA